MKTTNKSVQKLENLLGRNTTGIIMAVLSCIPYWFGSLYIKLSENKNDWHVFLYFRGLVGFVLGLSVFRKYNMELEIPTRKDFLNVSLRNFLSLVQACTFFYAIKYIPLSHVYIIQNTSPIITYFLDRIIYQKQIQFKHIFALIISFIGILLVLDPQFVIDLSHTGQQLEDVSSKNSTKLLQVSNHTSSTMHNIDFQKIKEMNIDTAIFNYIILAIGSVCISFSWAVTRKLQNVTSHHINLHLNFFFCSAGAIYMLLSGQYFSWGVIEVLSNIFILGLLFFIGQYGWIYALTMASSHQVSICVYLLIIFSFIYEVIFLGMMPSALNIGGSFMLLIGLYVILFSQDDETQQPQPQPQPQQQK